MTQNIQSLSWRYNQVGLYMLTSINGRCCTLKKSPLKSISSGSSVSATDESNARTEYVESYVECSELVPEFWGNPQIDALAACNFEDPHRKWHPCNLQFWEHPGKWRPCSMQFWGPPKKRCPCGLQIWGHPRNNVFAACNFENTLQTTSLQHAILRTP